VPRSPTNCVLNAKGGGRKGDGKGARWSFDKAQNVDFLSSMRDLEAMGVGDAKIRTKKKKKKAKHEEESWGSYLYSSVAWAFGGEDDQAAEENDSESSGSIRHTKSGGSMRHTKSGGSMRHTKSGGSIRHTPSSSFIRHVNSNSDVLRARSAPVVSNRARTPSPRSRLSPPTTRVGVQLHPPGKGYGRQGSVAPSGARFLF